MIFFIEYLVRLRACPPLAWLNFAELCEPRGHKVALSAHKVPLRKTCF